MDESTRALGPCAHHPERDCGCYCRFVGCSPETCPGEACPGEEPSAASKQFRSFVRCEDTARVSSGMLVGWLVAEAYAAHILMASLGFDSNHLQIHCPWVTNMPTPGRYVIVSLEEPNLPTYSIVLGDPVTEDDAEILLSAWDWFIDHDRPARTTVELEAFIAATDIGINRQRIMADLVKKDRLSPLMREVGARFELRLSRVFGAAPSKGSS